MNIKSSTTTNSDQSSIEAINDSKLAQFNLFFEYDNSLSDVRKHTRNRAND